MTNRYEELELLREMEEAQREVAESAVVTARARARRSPVARQQRRGRRLRIVTLCTLVASAVAWASLRVEGPSDAQLQHGPQLALVLAAEWTRDYVRSHGRLPERLAEHLPLGIDVKLKSERGGFHLSVKDPKGVEHAMFVPLDRRP